MLIEMMALDEKVWKAPEGQMAADHVPFVSGTDWEVGHPAHFKQRHRTLLQGGVPHGYKLSVLGFPIEQQQNSIRTEVQRIGLSGRRRCFPILPVRQLVDTACSHGKPHVDPTLTSI